MTDKNFRKGVAWYTGAYPGGFAGKDGRKYAPPKNESVMAKPDKEELFKWNKILKDANLGVVGRDGISLTTELLNRLLRIHVSQHPWNRDLAVMLFEAQPQWIDHLNFTYEPYRDALNRRFTEGIVDPVGSAERQKLNRALKVSVWLLQNGDYEYEGPGSRNIYEKITDVERVQKGYGVDDSGAEAHRVNEGPER